MERRQRGIIKSWRDEKGFGFIEPVDGGPDLFFHANDVKNSRRRDLAGQRVTYVLVPGRDGKPAAGDVRLAVVEDHFRPEPQRLSGRIGGEDLGAKVADARA